MKRSREQAEHRFAEEVKLLKRERRCVKCFIVRARLPEGFNCQLDRCPREFEAIDPLKLQAYLTRLETLWCVRRFNGASPSASSGSYTCGVI